MSKIRIALADDHTIVRKSIASMLEVEADFEVVADACNGRELLQKLSALKTPPDVCLLDVNMPEMNGYESLVALRGKYPGLHFLILTQLEHEYVIIKMLKAGARGYMLKDSEPSELKQAIRTIKENSYHHSQLVDGHLISLVTKNKEYTKLSLTDREQEFLKHCCSELPYKAIAGLMNVTERTVAFYRQTMFDKLDTKSRTGLALFALKLGLVPMDDM